MNNELGMNFEESVLGVTEIFVWLEVLRKYTITFSNSTKCPGRIVRLEIP
jgi:hypothetical protein